MARECRAKQTEKLKAMKMRFI